MPAPEDKLQWQDTAGGPQEALEALLEKYQRHFDIQRDVQLLGRTLAAKAHFYSRGERYVLTKKARLWGVECSEHVFFFTPAQLDPGGLADIVQLLVEAEPQLVKPHPEHMYTYLSAVVLTTQLDDAAAKALRKYKWRKNYKLSLQGWCNIRLAALDLSSGLLATNRDGKELRGVLAGLNMPVSG